MNDLKPSLLSHIPNLKYLLLAAATKFHFKKKRDYRLTVLPKLTYQVNDVPLNEPAITGFHKVVRWLTHDKVISPCYLHVLAFPLHLKLMLSDDFPFPILGLIHIGNQVKQYRPVQLEEQLSLICGFTELEQHAKGWSFTIECQFLDAHKVIWESKSQYLYKTVFSKVSDSHHVKHGTNSPTALALDFSLSSDLGRQYAKVSGDYNPIHLHPLSAKLFGLKRHIIHGMWTKAFALSNVKNTNVMDFSHPFQINTKFRKPLYLPNSVYFSTSNVSLNEERFIISSESKYAWDEHLLGVIKLI